MGNTEKCVSWTVDIETQKINVMLTVMRDDSRAETSEMRHARSDSRDGTRNPRDETREMRLAWWDSRDETRVMRLARWDLRDETSEMWLASWDARDETWMMETREIRLACWDSRDDSRGKPREIRLASVLLSLRTKHILPDRRQALKVCSRAAITETSRHPGDWKTPAIENNTAHLYIF